MKHLVILICILPFLCQCKTWTRHPSQGASLGIAKSLAWKKSRFLVCWEPQERDSKGIRKLEFILQNAITEEFTKEKNAVEFYGFEPCGKDRYDLRIAWSPDLLSGKMAESNHLGQIAMSTGRPKPTITVYYRLISMSTFQNKIPLDYTMSQYVLHELGHFLGLNHEHAHPKSSCRVNLAFAKEGFNEKVEFDKQYPTHAGESHISYSIDYDPYSIMSYCNLEMGLYLKNKSHSKKEMKSSLGLYYDQAVELKKIRAGLSQADDLGLKKIYK